MNYHLIVTSKLGVATTYMFNSLDSCYQVFNALVAGYVLQVNLGVSLGVKTIAIVDVLQNITLETIGS